VEDEPVMSLVEPEVADLHLTRFARLGVRLVHGRVAEPELKGDAGPHHTDTVDRVDEGLSLRCEQVTVEDAEVSHRDTPATSRLALRRPPRSVRLQTLRSRHRGLLRPGDRSASSRRRDRCWTRAI